MKQLLYTLALAAAFLCFSSTAQARGIIFYQNGENLVVAHTLPDSMCLDNGHHLDIGVKFNEFSIMWIPAWTWGPMEYVLYDKKGDAYATLDEEDIALYNETFNLNLDPEKPSLPFWHKIGGKVIWAVLILSIVWSSIGGKKDEEEESPADSATEEPQKEE